MRLTVVQTVSQPMLTRLAGKLDFLLKAAFRIDRRPHWATRQSGRIAWRYLIGRGVHMGASVQVGVPGDGQRSLVHRRELQPELRPED